MSEARVTLPSEEILTRYAISAPRYTSYPTALEFSPTFTEKDWRLSLRQTFSLGSENNSAAIYIHIPFCKSLCYYCACNKVITQSDSVIDPYLSALRKEMSFLTRELDNQPVVSHIHWGGGTPNFLSPKAMAHLHNACLQSFSGIGAQTEFSVEIDPRTTASEQLETLSQLGCNRISLGVQDFDVNVQQLINRHQTFIQTEQVFKKSRTLGIKSINLDLIYGLPNQTIDSFKNTLRLVTDLRPERIALYGYAHVTWIKKAQKALERAHLPTPIERARLFSLATDFLIESGYRYIGLDHFVLPEDNLYRAFCQGTLRRNFMGYTDIGRSSVLGFGVSAISSLPKAFAQNVKDLGTYQQRISETGFATERGIWKNDEDILRGNIIEELLCHRRINFSHYEQGLGKAFLEQFSESITNLAPLINDNLIRIDSNGIELTEKGYLFARHAALAFDGYFHKYSRSKSQSFSQSL